MCVPCNSCSLSTVCFLKYCWCYMTCIVLLCCTHHDLTNQLIITTHPHPTHKLLVMLTKMSVISRNSRFPVRYVSKETVDFVLLSVKHNTIIWWCCLTKDVLLCSKMWSISACLVLYYRPPAECQCVPCDYRLKPTFSCVSKLHVVPPATTKPGCVSYNIYHKK